MVDFRSPDAERECFTCGHMKAYHLASKGCVCVVVDHRHIQDHLCDCVSFREIKDIDTKGD